MARPPFGLIVNFCTVFASFIFRLNRKICVPLLLVTVRVFCQLKAASKCTQSSKLIILGTKMFFWGGAQPLNYPRPMRLAFFLLKSFTVMGYRRGLIAIFSVGLLQLCCVIVVTSSQVMNQSSYRGKEEVHNNKNSKTVTNVFSFLSPAGRFRKKIRQFYLYLYLRLMGCVAMSAVVTHI